MSTPKAAKKAAAKHAPHENPALKDRRRAHEHLGRVEALNKSVEKPAAKDITTLTELAHQEIEAGHMKDAADLLRAAEHLSFGSIHPPKNEGLDPELVAELTREFEGKLAKADEHWSGQEEHLEGLEAVFEHAKERARKDFEAGAYRKGLELARAAEALGHVKVHGDAEGDAGLEEEESSEGEAE